MNLTDQFVDFVLVHDAGGAVDDARGDFHQPFNNLTQGDGVFPQQIHVAAFQVALQALDAGGDQIVGLRDGLFEWHAVFFWNVGVGFHRQFPIGKGALPHMVLIIHGLPFLGQIQNFRHVGNHFEQHDDFVEVIQIVRRQQRLFVDVAAPDLFPKSQKICAFGVTDAVVV